MSKRWSQAVSCCAGCSSRGLRRSLPLGVADAASPCILAANPFQQNRSVPMLSSGHHNQPGLGNGVLGGNGQCRGAAGAAGCSAHPPALP